jgi:Uma2 family endonuclease
MPNKALTNQPGPFRTDQLKSGDPYELSQGHPVVCLPTGGRGSGANRVGAQVLGTDPDVMEAGVDTGYALSADTLRAPDVAVGNVPDRPGWVQGVPPLAVEYADTGQDETELQAKIAELLGAGTRWVWVVRLGMPRQVEVHAPEQPVVIRRAGELLEAPGVLRNPVPVQALYDPQAAHAATLRNLLQRAGYEGIDAVRDEGKVEGKIEGKAEILHRQLRRRFGAVPDWAEQRIAGASGDQLDAWLDGIFDAEGIEGLIGPVDSP